MRRISSSSNCTGAIQSEGIVNVSMDSDSSWTLTGDSAVSSLDGDLSGLNLNGYRLYKNSLLFEK